MAAKKKLDETAAIVMLLETLAEPGETPLACLKRYIRGGSAPAEPSRKSLLEDPDAAAAFAKAKPPSFCDIHGRQYRGPACDECEGKIK